MGLIKHLHKIFSEEISQMNSVITSHLCSQEQLIEEISRHLIGAGGKRLRPLLTIITSKMFNYNGENHIKLAAAVEFIHAATLLHDDVVDESKMRRFQATANTIWGNKASILVGDFLFSQSFKLMVAANSFDALKSLANASAVIAQGEVSQLAKLNEKRLIIYQEYLEIITAKTAALFGAACEVGAIIASQEEKISSTLKNFGIKLGQIFQIIDDNMDYFSNNAKTGKNSGDDFFEGKVTLPLIVLYDHCQSHEKQLIENLIAKKEKTADDFKEILNLLDKYQIQEKINNFLINFRNDAINILQDINIENSFKGYLLSLVDFAIERTN